MRRFIIFIILFLSIGLFISKTYLFSPPPSSPSPPPEGKIVVAITGAVNKPGVLELPVNARLKDAIQLCGGLQSNAVSPNLAQILEDGQHIHVEQHLVLQTPSPEKTSSSQEQKRVNINTADQKTLASLTGIGEKMAQRIIEYREQNGAFQNLSDLQKVKGIGKAKYQKLEAQITL